MTTWITICDTCKSESWDGGGIGTSHGEQLAKLVEAAAKDTPFVKTRRHSCLMGCARGCNVAIQAKGKLSYTLGELEPEPEAAQALVDYAMLHSEMETGVVPYRQWPQPIKGHFVTRHPPLPEDD